MKRQRHRDGRNGTRWWSWLCLVVLGSLAAASVGDAIGLNGRLRQAAMLVIGTLGGPHPAYEADPGYSAVIQRKVIAGIRGPQGLSYSSSRRTLLTVIEPDQMIAELDLCGRLLRRISVRSQHPLEEITALSGDAILLSYTKTNRISLLRLPSGTVSLDATKGLDLDLRHGNNKIEAEEIAWDPVGQQLYLASKNYPPRIYRSAFSLSEWLERPPGSYTLQAREWLSADMIKPFMPDITALAFSEARQELLILSDETNEIMAARGSHEPRLYLRLIAGRAGLEENISTPEGMAIASDASLYLISDPTQVYLYRFYPEQGLGRQSVCLLP